MGIYVTGAADTDSGSDQVGQSCTDIEPERHRNRVGSRQNRDRGRLSVFIDTDTNLAAFIYEMNTICLPLALSLSASESVAVPLWLYDRHKPGRIHIRETRRACEHGV